MRAANTPTALHYLNDLWEDSVARSLDEPELLRYRSNLLGRDLRITNFGGGNTSSKILQPDPLDGTPQPVLWVKGSGGDLGSIKRSGFARLYLNKLLALEPRYHGAEHEDEMAELYPLCAFDSPSAPPSIDTPLHAFLPFAHIDHLHPDAAIALAAAANGRERLREFNRQFGRWLIWVAWRRPGFELAMMLRRAVAEHAGCDGAVLASHGLFTWGETQRECYANSVAIIDELEQFIAGYREAAGDRLFGGARYAPLDNRRELAIAVLPRLRGSLAHRQRVIGHYSDAPEVLRFVNSGDARALARLGTSCPDHFIRTKIRPLFVDWEPRSDGAAALRAAIGPGLEHYRREYEAYYRAYANADSPAMRDPHPAVVLVPGVGLFSFGKSKTEARITAEFYVNAIRVMAGATALGGSAEAAAERAEDDVSERLPASENGSAAAYRNYVALPPAEAFRIEYWQLEEAKLRRQPPEKELSRRVVFICGAAHGIGRETARLAALRGAHVVMADYDAAACVEAAARVTAEAQVPTEYVTAAAVDVRERESIRQALRAAIAAYGGIDILVHTAALFLTGVAGGQLSDEQWRATLDVNVTGTHLLVDELRQVFADQGLPASIVLTSSANAVVAKAGSEAYDISKAAVSHLVRELAVALAPLVRVNGISPATVVKSSTMFPRERLLASLAKYNIPHNQAETTEQLRDKLAGFYAQRTLIGEPIDPADCAEAALFLASDRARRTTGHVLPIDGGLPDAFLR